MKGLTSLRIGAAALVALAPLAVHSAARAQAGVGEAGTWLIRGGTVVTGTGQQLANASVLIQDGNIAAVGANVTAPAGAVTIDATGKFVYPGMFDGYTPMGLSEIGSVQTTNMTSEIGEYNPHMRAIVAVNIESEMYAITRANGVTHVITAPGGGVISGQAALINMSGWTWEDLAVETTAAYVVNYPRTPSFRFGGSATPAQERAAEERVKEQVGELSTFLRTVAEYDRVRTAGARELDITYESARAMIRGEEPVLVSADQEEQIRGALELADSFGLKIIILGGDEAWKVADELAQREVPVVLGSLQSTPASDAPYDAIYAQPGVLHRAGVKFAFSTGGASNARHVPYHAALAVAYDLDPDAAIQALTLWPAQIFGVDDRLGSIETGKMANLFIANGDPLDVRTVVEEIFIKGRRMPHDDRHTRLYEKWNARPREGGN